MIGLIISHAAWTKRYLKFCPLRPGSAHIRAFILLSLVSLGLCLKIHAYPICPWLYHIDVKVVLAMTLGNEVLEAMLLVLTTNLKMEALLLHLINLQSHQSSDYGRVKNTGELIK